MSKHTVLDWLLESEQPAVRYQALTDLLDRSANNSEVREAYAKITGQRWAADILNEQLPGGYWASAESLYGPKYVATNWQLLVLADLGLTVNEPRVKSSCELILKHFAKPDGGFGTQRMETSHLCVAGNTARALIQFGYLEDPRVKSAVDWLVKEQKEDGGWHCWASRGTLDCWEGLSAFAALPRAKWTRSVKRSVERGAEFYLERKLYRQGRRYEPWFRFHYPIHYYYDVLVGLDVLTALGYSDDKRLAYGLRLLTKKRRPDGTWLLDAVHPDVADSYAVWLKKSPKPPIAFSLEKVGEPSKMVTLRALRVLKRVEGEVPGS